MKKVKFLLGVMLSIATITSQAQTVDEIIAKNITARGGLDNVKKLNSVKMTGTINAQGQEMQIVLTCLNNKGMRTDMTIGGMANYSIITTTGGWNYWPIGGQQKPEAMTEDEVKVALDELDLQGPLVDYKVKGHTVEYVGKDEVEGTECYKLKVVHKNGVEQTVYIDPTTNYMIRSVEKTKVGGKEVEQTVNFSNFQKLPEGLVWPMTIEQGGGAITFKSVEINKPVDENVFKVAAN